MMKLSIGTEGGMDLVLRDDGAVKCDGLRSPNLRKFVADIRDLAERLGEGIAENNRSLPPGTVQSHVDLPGMLGVSIFHGPGFAEWMPATESPGFIARQAEIGGLLAEMADVIEAELEHRASPDRRFAVVVGHLEGDNMAYKIEGQNRQPKVEIPSTQQSRRGRGPAAVLNRRQIPAPPEGMIYLIQRWGHGFGPVPQPGWQNAKCSMLPSHERITLVPRALIEHEGF